MLLSSARSIQQKVLFLPTIAEFAPCEPLAVAGIVAGVRQLCGQAETSPANTVDKGGQVSCN